jgi:heme/copper-type cytochrome/quinol oxidase subunit 2
MMSLRHTFYILNARKKRESELRWGYAGMIITLILCTGALVLVVMAFLIFNERAFQERQQQQLNLME